MKAASLDVVLELVGLPATMQQTVQLLAILGRVGIIELSFATTPYTELLNKETKIIGVSDHLAQEIPLLIDLGVFLWCGSAHFLLTKTYFTVS